MRKALTIGAIGLLASALACSLGGSDGPGATGKGVETRVAETLTALAPTEVPAGAATPAPSPTSAGTAEPAPPAGGAPPAVVYTDGGHPWILPAGGSPRQLSELDGTFDVLISDDGQRVVFLRREASDGPPTPAEIVGVNADGTDQATLLAPGALDELYPPEELLHNDVSSIAFIPGTHDLLLNTRAVAEGPGLIKYDDLLRMDGDTGELITLLEPEVGGEFQISPDGSRAAVVQPDSIGLVDTDGSNHQPGLIPYERIITYSEFEYYAQPTWSIDGTQLGVALPTSDILADELTGEVWQVARDGTGVSNRGSFSGDFYFPQQGRGSLLAPTLEHVAFRRTGPERSLIVSDLEGGTAEEYDRQVGSWSGWSPDGQHFIYAKGDPAVSQLGSLGAAPRPLPNGTEYLWYSPDGFYFLEGSRGDWTLRRGSVAGEASNLVSPEADFVSYDFTGGGVP